MKIELPKQRSERLNKQEEFILKNTVTTFESNLMDDVSVLDFLKKRYPEQKPIKIENIFRIYKEGLDRLKSISKSNTQNKWHIKSDMFIPSNKHVHTSVLDYDPITAKFIFTFKDDETFKLSRFNIYKILALMTFHFRDNLKTKEASTVLMNQTYEQMLQNLSNEHRGLSTNINNVANKKFVESILEDLIANLEKEFSKSEMPFTMQNIHDKLTGGTFFKLVDKCKLSEFMYEFNSIQEDEATISINRINFIKKVRSLLEQNQNGILDFYSKAYFQTYNCGQIEFTLKNNELELISGKTSCTKNPAVEYLLDFIYSLSSDTEETQVQSSQYDIKFSGLINGIKQVEPPETQSKYQGQKNFPFPFKL